MEFAPKVEALVDTRAKAPDQSSQSHNNSAGQLQPTECESPLYLNRLAVPIKQSEVADTKPRHALKGYRVYALGPGRPHGFALLDLFVAAHLLPLSRGMIAGFGGQLWKCWFAIERVAPGVA